MATYYVATNGNDSRTSAQAQNINTPWATVQHAVDTAIAGDTVYFRGGTYTIPDANRDNVIIFPNSGTSGNPIRFYNYPDEYPIFDFILNVPPGAFNNAFYLENRSWIEFKGFTIRNVVQLTDDGVCGIMAWNVNNMRFENLIIHDIGGVGLSYWTDGSTDISYFINCDVYNCLDDQWTVNPGGHADGFWIQAIIGGHMYIEGCRAWACSDDGFNLDGGGIMEVKNCWSFSNGNLLYDMGDGNGFKLGPAGSNDGTSIYRIVTNCIAANNHQAENGGAVAAGFNHNNGQNELDWPRSRIYNCFSYHNDLGFWVQPGSAGGIMDDVYRNNISYMDDKYYASWPVEPTIHDHNTFEYQVDWPYSYSVISLTNADFISLDVSQLSRSRKADWSLPDITFGHLAENSDLIGAGIKIQNSLDGVDLTLDGDGNLYKDPPSIGPFEYNASTPGIDIVIHKARIHKWSKI
jgi:hypothetical protein